MRWVFSEVWKWLLEDLPDQAPLLILKRGHLITFLPNFKRQLLVLLLQPLDLSLKQLDLARIHYRSRPLLKGGDWMVARRLMRLGYFQVDVGWEPAVPFTQVWSRSGGGVREVEEVRRSAAVVGVSG